MSELDLSQRAAELRRSFDASFSKAQNNETPSIEALLLVHLGSDPYALRLSDISGLFADKKIVSLPSRVAELLGVIGLRGSLLPVYDLGALLGHSPLREPRWLVTTRAIPVALGLSSFEGYLRLPQGAVVPKEGSSWRHSQEVAHTANDIRPIINISAVLETIKERASLVRSVEG